MEEKVKDLFVDVEITDAVPMPQRQTFRWRELAERMKTGDSVVIDRRFMNGLQAALNSRGFRVCTEELENGKVRVWKGPSFEVSGPVRFRVRMALEKAGCDIQEVRGELVKSVQRIDRLEAEFKKERDLLDTLIDTEAA